MAHGARWALVVKQRNRERLETDGQPVFWGQIRRQLLSVVMTRSNWHRACASAYELNV